MHTIPPTRRTSLLVSSGIGLLALLTAAGIAARVLPLRSPAGPAGATVLMAALLAAAAWCAAAAPGAQGAARAAGRAKAG